MGIYGEIGCDYGPVMSQGERVTGCWSLPRVTNGFAGVTDALLSSLFVTWPCTVASRSKRD